MKQLVLMIALTSVGIGGAFYAGPVVGLAIYYLFAVLRPQFMWEWSLPQGVSWSQYVALATLLATVGYGFGMVPFSGLRAPVRPRMNTSHLLTLLFGLWVCLSYLGAYNIEVAERWVQEYIKIFVMFWVGAVVVRTPRQLWAIYVLVTVALIYIAYEMNYLYVVNRYLSIYRRGYGGLDNNGAALMLAMGVPLAIYAWEATTKMWRWVYIAGVPLIIHAVLMSYSRGAMLSLLVVSPLLILRTRRRWQFTGVALAVVLLVPVLAGQEIRQRFFSINEYEIDASANSRFQSWKAAVAIANDYPFFGVGIRNSNLLSYHYGADMEGRTIHSQYLQILADSGYPALVLYIAGILATLLVSQRSLRHLKGRSDVDSARMFAMARGLQASLLTFCVGGLFLSLEVFELPYIVTLLSAQTAALVKLRTAVPAQATSTAWHPQASAGLPDAYPSSALR